jgi:excinuclease ABC subunit C
VLETRGRPCLQYQIKRCSGPCAIDVPPSAYGEQVEDVKMFLSGKSIELVQRLRARMDGVPSAKTSRSRRYCAIRSRRSSARSRSSTSCRTSFVDQDVWGLYREAEVVEVVVPVRPRGQARRAAAHFHQKDQELPDAAVLAGARPAVLRDRHLIPDESGRRRRAGGWRGARGVVVRRARAKGQARRARRGIRARLVELADRNAAASAAVARKNKGADADAMLQKVADRLGLPRPPRRIECFDIAHIQGTDTVASMVTFVDGVPARGLYRKFKLRTGRQQRLRAMYEVLTRGSSARWAMTPAWARPDLLVIDGGKGPARHGGHRAHRSRRAARRRAPASR